MRVSQEKLEELRRKDLETQEELLQAWVRAAEEELASGETPREEIYFPLLWTQTEVSRFSLHTGRKPSHLEAHAFELVCEMSSRIRKARGEEDNGKLIRK